MEQYIEELKRLFYSDRLTQYGKKKLIEYYEQRIKQLEEENKKYIVKLTDEEYRRVIEAAQKDCVPTSLVKEKIEKLDNVDNAEALEDLMNRQNYTITELVQFVLREILKEKNSD